MAISADIRGDPNWRYIFHTYTRGTQAKDVWEVWGCRNGRAGLDRETWIGLFKLRAGGFMFVEADCNKGDSGYEDWEKTGQGFSKFYRNQAAALQDISLAEARALDLEPQWREAASQRPISPPVNYGRRKTRSMDLDF